MKREVLCIHPLKGILTFSVFVPTDATPALTTPPTVTTETVTTTAAPSVNAGAIAGGVVGGLIVLGLICGALIFLLRGRKRTVPIAQIVQSRTFKSRYHDTLDDGDELQVLPPRSQDSPNVPRH